MERLCTRCAHLRLRVGGQTGGRTYAAVRSFTSTSASRDDTPSSGGKSTLAPLRRDGQPRTQPQQPLRRQPAGSSGQPSALPPLRRTGPPRPGQLLRKPSDRPSSATGQRTPRSGPSSGPGLLRRTTAPTGPGQRGRGPPGRGPPGAQQGKKKDSRRRAQRKDGRGDGEAEVDTKAVDEYVENYLDPPQNPTKHLPYSPANLTLADLKPDWPDTPMSTSGLSESILLKIQWLAHRLPHGYQSPRALAEHFLKGELTRFENAEEKAEVLKVAAELKDELAAIEPRKRDAPLPIATDAGFQDLTSEKAFLVDGTVKGTIGDLEKQKYPFLDNVVSGLRNNGTYGDVQAAKFMDAISRLIPQQMNKQGAKKAGKAA